jgi:hypothetical protein
MSFYPFSLDDCIWRHCDSFGNQSNIWTNIFSFVLKKKKLLLSKTLILFSLVPDSILICYNTYLETLDFISSSLESIFPSQIHKKVARIKYLKFLIKLVRAGEMGHKLLIIT